MKFSLTIISRGDHKIDESPGRIHAEFRGVVEVDPKASEFEAIMATEQFIERLTGLRVHIDQEHGS